ncbi:MAG TPA: polyphenol oxidase family protein [Thermoleophilia bacterium]|nr:polyphenol oxidase family protein [Thermoleophilia bacterium]
MTVRGPLSGAPALVTHDDGGLVWFEAGGRGWRVAFSTRLGGVSAPPFDQLNLGFSTDDDPAAVWANRVAFARAAGLDAGDLVVPGQVHGTVLAEVGSGQRGRGARGPADVLPATDGLFTHEPGVPMFVSFADCVPVVVAADDGAGGVRLALVHAGWRGMVAGIVAAAARAAGAEGALRAAVIGPSICPRCFEVSPDVGEPFEAAFPGTWHDGRVDLWESARRQLRDAGLATDLVLSTGLCTCHDRRFFSHRRERGLTGRQAAIAWVTARGG